MFERQQVSRGARWLESLVITVSAPVLGSLVVPDDPYLLRAAFPWLVLAPLAVALQHGVWAGLFSSTLLCAGAVWQAVSLGPLPASFASFGIACTVIALIAGQFRDAVRGRSESHEQRADELADRLERSERSRHLIQLSHSKLVERVAATRSSLVAAIDGAQRRMDDASTMNELGQVLLDVLATQGNLHAASLYIASRDGSSLLVQAVASFGGNSGSTARHALVVRAFSSGKLAVIVDSGDVVTDKSVLAAVPLITSQRQTLGVVAVHQMPFMAFQAEHLNQLFVLAGHLSDMLRDRWATLGETRETRGTREELPALETHAPTPTLAAGQPAALPLMAATSEAEEPELTYEEEEEEPVVKYVEESLDHEITIEVEEPNEDDAPEIERKPLRVVPAIGLPAPKPASSAPAIGLPAPKPASSVSAPRPSTRDAARWSARRTRHITTTMVMPAVTSEQVELTARDARVERRTPKATKTIMTTKRPATPVAEAPKPQPIAAVETVEAPVLETASIVVKTSEVPAPIVVKTFEAPARIEMTTVAAVDTAAVSAALKPARIPVEAKPVPRARPRVVVPQIETPAELVSANPLTRAVRMAAPKNAVALSNERASQLPAAPAPEEHEHEPVTVSEVAPKAVAAPAVPVKPRTVTVPPPPASVAKHAGREDVTETRMRIVEKKGRHAVRSRQVTQDFPAVKPDVTATATATVTTQAPEVAAEAAAPARPRAQATIRSQVAEAAARRTSSV